jgi:serine/threonine protein kinase
VASGTWQADRPPAEDSSNTSRAGTLDWLSPDASAAQGDPDVTIDLLGSLSSVAKGQSKDDPTQVIPSSKSDQTSLDEIGRGPRPADATGEWASSDDAPTLRRPDASRKGTSGDSPASSASEKTGLWTTPGDGATGKSIAALPSSRGSPPPLIAGYEILKELGRGAMGVVYKARQVTLNRLVALKMVLSGQHASERELMRFHIEAEAVARLKHPNIVQIYEIGESEGRPFFSLEYVDGGILSDRIGTTPIAPRDAAWVVQQLASGMDCAHRAGVVHRDLKPANVLLARSEERGANREGIQAQASKAPPLTECVPKVTDFGLAKRLEDDSSQTRAGSILGTPSYMAPEQAEGRTSETGPPADIYALGAILYDLLTGRPPFQGNTVLETLQQVKKMEPTSPRRYRPSLPRDLDTICLKCLEKDPARRYASAGDLAEDLRRFLAGEPITARRVSAFERAWKWCKRRPAAAALIAVSTLAVLGGITGGAIWADEEHRRAIEEAELRKTAEEQQALAETERARAEEQKGIAETQRARAEENLRDAERAVDTLLTRIGRERLENEPRMEKVRRDLLESALDFYKRFLEQHGDDPTLRAQAGRAQRSVGDIRAMLGEPDPADQAYLRAITLFQGLDKEFPSKPEYRQELALTLSNRGKLLSDRNDNAGAEKVQQDACDILQGLVDQLADKPVYRQELAAAHSNRGTTLLALGRRGDADVALKRGLDLRVHLAADHPRNALYQSELAGSYTAHGVLMQTYHRLTEAEAAYAQAAEILTRLCKELPERWDFQSELANVLSNQATALQALRKLPEAEKAFRQAVERRQQVADHFPSVPLYQAERARARFLLASLLQTTNQRPEAERLLGQAIDEFRRLIERYPLETGYRHGLASCLNNLGDILLDTMRLQDGLKVWREAADILDRLAHDVPNLPLYVFEQTNVLHNLGGALPDANEFTEAEKKLGQAIALRQKLVETYRKEVLYRQKLADSYGELAIVQAKRNQTDKAVETFRKAIELLQKFDREDPNQSAYWQEELRQQTNLAALFQALGKTKEADACKKRMEELTAKLAKPGIK